MQRGSEKGRLSRMNQGLRPTQATACSTTPVELRLGRIEHRPCLGQRRPRIIPDGPPDVQHETMEVPDVVQAQQDATKHLPGHKQVSEIGSRKPA